MRYLCFVNKTKFSDSSHGPPSALSYSGYLLTIIFEGERLAGIKAISSSVKVGDQIDFFTFLWQSAGKIH